jgi:LacI family transcriptional regulator of maltose regulon
MIKRFIDRQGSQPAGYGYRKKITINDVALAAGVSVSTVSLVLSGKGRISSATGERLIRPSNSWDLCATARPPRCAAGRAGDWPYRQRSIKAVLCRDNRRPHRCAGGGENGVSHPGGSGEKMAQRFDTLAAQGWTG